MPRDALIRPSVLSIGGTLWIGWCAASSALSPVDGPGDHDGSLHLQGGLVDP
jgi:hypothetical protein